MPQTYSGFIRLILAALVTGCGATGQVELALPASAIGRAPKTVAVGAYEVTLEVASIGFGPLYFCATAAASSALCPVAQAEFAATALVDGLDAAPQSLGLLRGVTGAIRSCTFDFGLTWLAVEQQPTSHVEGLDGHSAHFEGRYGLGGGPVRRFVADVDVRPQLPGTHAVQGARTTVDIADERQRLAITFDPTSWWATVDFSEFDSWSGDPLVVPAESRAHSAVVLAMTATHQPSFGWSSEP